MFQDHPKIKFKEESHLDNWNNFLGISSTKGNGGFPQKKLRLLDYLSKQPIIYKSWSNKNRYVFKNHLATDAVMKVRKQSLNYFSNFSAFHNDETIYKHVCDTSKIYNHKMEIEVEYSIYASERPLSTLSLSNSTLLVGSFGGETNLYETNCFSKISSYSAHQGKINDSVGLNDDLFLTAGSDGKIFLVSKDNVSLQYTNSNPIQHLSLNPSGILSAAEKLFRITFIDLSNFKPILSQNCHNGSIHGVDFDLTGSIYLTSGSDKKINVWDFRNGRLLNSLKSQDEITSIKFSKNGYQFLIGCDSGAIRKFDLRNFSITNEVFGHTSSVINLIEEGELLLSSSYDGHLSVYDPLNFKIFTNQRIHDSKITDLVTSSSNNPYIRYISCGYDKTFKEGFIK
jgi:WD40 repeat protein